MDLKVGSGSAVLPGDVVGRIDSTEEVSIRLGAGLGQRKDAVVASRAGKSRPHCSGMSFSLFFFLSFPFHRPAD